MRTRSLLYLHLMGLLTAVVLSGCTSEGFAVFPSYDHLDYVDTTTGFKVSKPKGERLIIRPVQDHRAQFLGQQIGGHKARNTDSAVGRNMALEFEMILERELRESNLFKNVTVNSNEAKADDFVLMTELQVLFPQLQGVLIQFASSVTQFKVVLKRGNAVLLQREFLGTANEKERQAMSGFFSTNADAMDDAASISIRKTLTELLKAIDSIEISNQDLNAAMEDELLRHQKASR